MRVNVLSRGNKWLNVKERTNIYTQWEQFKDKINLNSPAGMRKSFQNAGFMWAAIELEEAFYGNAVQGLILSLVFAFLVILLATHNLVVSLYAVLTIS